MLSTPSVQCFRLHPDSKRGRSMAKLMRRYVVPLLVVVCFAFKSESSLFAQCQPGFTGPYTTTMTVTTNCGATLVQVTYCKAGPGTWPPYEYQITGTVVLSPSGSGCQITGGVMREIARKLIQQNPGGFSCSPNCPQIIPVFKIGWGTCWRQLPGTDTWEPCPTPANQGCLDYFAVCCRCDGSLTAFYQGSGGSDQCEYETGCTTMCAPPAAAEPIVCPGTGGILPPKKDIK